MGWRGNEVEVPLGMLFRKMYCRICSTKLKRKKISVVCKKGDINYTNRLLGKATLGMSEIQKSEYVYECPKCKVLTTYNNQLRISKLQKKTGKKILSDEELEN